VLLGKGDGSFQPVVTYSSTGLQALSVAVADVNGDGKPDLIVANRYACANLCAHGSVVVRLGNGDGTFQSAAAYDSGGGGAWSVAVADVNADGKADLLVANGDNTTAAVLLGQGNGNFQSAVAYGLSGGGTLSLVVADVNGDSKPDLLVATCASSGCASGTVAVLLGNGDGTFQAVMSYESGGSQPISLAVADVNGDGKPDLIVANYPSNSIGVLLGKGDGTFQAAVDYGSGGQQPKSVTVADVNGDGKPDVLVANIAYTAAVLLGNGDGTFQAAVDYGSGGVYPLSIAAADLNGDGKPDLVVGNISGTKNTDGSVGVLLNNTAFCTTPPVITVFTTPTAFWPPNGNMVPVNVFGTITNAGCTVTAAAYAVTDEYGKVQPRGPVTLSPGGAYSFTILLKASRAGTDINGRVYTVTVSASNNAPKTGSRARTVLVPHDQRH
jgi:uncharacterized protein (UPF0548 family)